jgi:hypothetical protein
MQWRRDQKRPKEEEEEGQPCLSRREEGDRRQRPEPETLGHSIIFTFMSFIHLFRCWG